MPYLQEARLRHGPWIVSDSEEYLEAQAEFYLTLFREEPISTPTPTPPSTRSLIGHNNAAFVYMEADRRAMTTPRWEAGAGTSSVRTSSKLVRQRAMTTPRWEAGAGTSSVRTSSKLVRQCAMTTPRWEAGTRDSSVRTSSKLARQSFGNKNSALIYQRAVSTTTLLAGAQEGFVLSHTPVGPIVHWPETDISHILPEPYESCMVSVLEERSPLLFQHGRELTSIPEDTPTEVIDNDSLEVTT